MQPTTPVNSTETNLDVIRNFRGQTDLIYLNDTQEIVARQNQPILEGEQHIGSLPGLYPEWLGDRSFLAKHNLRFAYVGGAMARGIASAELVIELAKSGCLGFFGSAGLPISKTEEALQSISKELDPIQASWGVNIIHTPATPEEEDALIDLYLKYNVKRVSAAAFMSSNKALIRYVALGLTQDVNGTIQRNHYIFPKVSRAEVASHFLKPAEPKLVAELLSENAITPEQAHLISQIPLAEDLTVESDSGGHTDSRPLNSLFSSIIQLRDDLQLEFNFQTPVRLGAAGSLGTPESIAAAYTLGAAYVLLGSVHQSALESGLSSSAKNMLAHAQITDTIVCPSADMFEIGGKVQVLKKGTMMGIRGNRLHELYTRYSSIEDIPQNIKAEIEKSIFRDSIETIWNQTQEFFKKIDPREVERAIDSPKYKMALIFRWYLGNSSKWALIGTEERKMDYQIWCGPAMGAFNSWTKGSALEHPENRRIQQILLNLLEGAAMHIRAQQLRSFGVEVHSHQVKYTPSYLSL